ncbi:MAG: hypothetical protein H0U26_08555 [Acidimicrobiia bacterium]|nr:hypothetical protein [Acidimicrobiia bacterium]
MVLGEWPSSNSDRDAGKPMSAERSISGASGNGSRMPMSAVARSSAAWQMPSRLSPSQARLLGGGDPGDGF